MTAKMMGKVHSILICWIMLCSSKDIFADEYHIGPGKTYTSPGEFPWENVKEGDVINIFWRDTPYKSMFVISANGTIDKPIVVRGIPGPDGKLPVIAGNQAIARLQLDYNAQERGIIKIGVSEFPSSSKASYLLLENLEFTSARSAYNFIGKKGLQKFAANASGIYLEHGDNITIRNCIFRDCANGLFIAHESENILLESCQFFDNGVEDSFYEHNVYSAAGGLTMQNCYLGALRKGCPGNNFKDRSAGLVVRYNWIEGGNRQLDLVDAEDSEKLRSDPRYANTLVYGNVLREFAGDGNSQMVHYGGDSGDEDGYRKGNLYFYHNTIISERKDHTCLFRATTPAESITAINNLIYIKSGGKNLSLLEEYGKLEFTNNWVSQGYRPSFEADFKGVISEGDNIKGVDPLFENLDQLDLRLKENSPCYLKGGPIPKELSKHYPVISINKERTIMRRRTKELSMGAYDAIRDNQ